LQYNQKAEGFDARLWDLNGINIYFQKINLVDRVYRLVDSARSRFTVVSRWRSCEGLSERMLSSDSGHRGSSRL
jgi:hypothetical protein